MKCAAGSAVLSSLLFLFFVMTISVPEGNAARRCNVKGKPAPDLVIITEGTSLKWSGKCNAVSPKIIGSVTIKNIGRADAPRAKKPIVSIQDENNEKCSVEENMPSALKPGEKVKIDIKGCRFISGQNLNGKRRIQLKIDKHQEIQECNERNNTWPGTFQIELMCSPGQSTGKHGKTDHSKNGKGKGH